MKRELDFKLEQLNERRAELKQEVEMVKGERADVTRHKDQLKVSRRSTTSLLWFLFCVPQLTLRLIARRGAPPG